jgi:uncharacterized membrane protein
MSTLTQEEGWFTVVGSTPISPIFLFFALIEGLCTLYCVLGHVRGPYSQVST